MTEEKKHTKKDRAICIFSFAAVIVCVIMLYMVISMYGPSFGAYLDSALEGDTETITIGDTGDTIIIRTQEVDCHNIDPLICVRKEIFTGVVINVDSDKIIFEDGVVLIGRGIDRFTYKIGSKHRIEVSIEITGLGYNWRALRSVTILN